MIPRPITESFDPFSVYIDSLFSIPADSSIKTLRVVVRLCYGNETKARGMSEAKSTVRNSYHSENVSLKPQVRFDQWISFDDARHCALQREALLLFEVFASFADELELSSPHFYEVFDGVPMRLIGWCSQALFDDDHHLITGERYLGVFDAVTTSRTGFYSLRNVFERNCPILSVSFLDQALVLPEVQARNDMHTVNFNEISRDKQEKLSRLLKRPSLLLVDHSVMIANDHRKQTFPMNVSDEGNTF